MQVSNQAGALGRGWASAVVKVLAAAAVLLGAPLNASANGRFIEFQDTPNVQKVRIVVNKSTTLQLVRDLGHQVLGRARLAHEERPRSHGDDGGDPCRQRNPHTGNCRDRLDGCGHGGNSRRQDEGRGVVSHRSRERAFDRIIGISTAGVERRPVVTVPSRARAPPIACRRARDAVHQRNHRGRDQRASPRSRPRERVVDRGRRVVL